VERTEYFELTYARKWLTDGLDAAIGYIVGAGTPTNFYYAGVHSSSPTNINGIKDTEIDGWADQVRTELDVEARKDLMRRIWDRMQEQVYRIETADQWRNTILGGSVRYWRWNGPYVTNYNGDVGSDFHKGWLDK
jgi:ABC-type transport system substrate-binding protein